MPTCRYKQDVESWFDGVSTNTAMVKAHVDTCHACQTHLAQLKRMRAGFAARNSAPEIADAQMPTFLRDLRRRVDTAQAQPVRFWTVVSAAAAALVVAVSLLTVFSSGPRPIEATVVEERSSDIQGATTDVFVADDGTTTVWVNLPEGDMW